MSALKRLICHLDPARPASSDTRRKIKKIRAICEKRILQALKKQKNRGVSPAAEPLNHLTIHPFNHKNFRTLKAVDITKELF
ncbi:hypothetical protein [Caldithrix abyssi]|uniref:hypothetical protein n=1 Tax=Caldithrix abyssi TaxID=187145 RepID=UPI0014724C99|nr:hypothetical protein [Caldithrix abyssi]